jgi:hypothetical protein
LKPYLAIAEIDALGKTGDCFEQGPSATNGQRTRGSTRGKCRIEGGKENWTRLRRGKINECALTHPTVVLLEGKRQKRGGFQWQGGMCFNQWRPLGRATLEGHYGGVLGARLTLSGWHEKKLSGVEA